MRAAQTGRELTRNTQLWRYRRAPNCERNLLPVLPLPGSALPMGCIWLYGLTTWVSGGTTGRFGSFLLPYCPSQGVAQSCTGAPSQFKHFNWLAVWHRSKNTEVKMKGEDTRQRQKAPRAKNGERSKQKAKNKSKQNEKRTGNREVVEEELPFIPEKRPPEKKPPMPKPGEESSTAIALQVILPYLLAGLGMVMAGMVLDVVQVREKHSAIFHYVNRLFDAMEVFSLPFPDIQYLSPLICAVFLILIPLWVAIAKQSPSIAEVLKSGWQPVIVAMSISSIGGLILDKTVTDPKFEGMAVFTPVINGVAGNLVAIQASRISTFLHFWSMPGVLPYKMRQHWPNPCTTFFSSGINSKSARVLFLLVVPGHLVFLYAIHLLQGGHTSLNVLFITFYLTAALLQVCILLYIADLIVRFMWRRGLDPDNFSIPYLTALGDLLGTGFLAICFRMVWLLTGTESELGN
eukprot:XP_017948711.1 PREDICTED: solute carrier family 41 member 1-like [Xenopus tropicalis]